MTKINLAALFKMKPKLASEYLKNKVSGTSWNWYEIYEKEHDKIFTVAKTAGYDVLKDIRAAVQKAIDEGQSLNSFKKELKPILTQKGWWGKVPDPSDPTKEVQLGSVRRLETIYRTNLRTSYQAGRYQSLEDNAEFRPYWQYIAVMDDRTRKEHKELHGKVFRHDDPFWENFFPPNGWNCRCTVKSLSQKDLDRLGLTVESSAGKLRNATAELPDGTKVSGKVYRTNGKIIQTDVGWNYNPGRSTYKPHDDGKDPELKAKFDRMMEQAEKESNALKSKKKSSEKQGTAKIVDQIEAVNSKSLKPIEDFTKLYTGRYHKDIKGFNGVKELETSDSFMDTQDGFIRISDKAHPDIPDFKPLTQLRSLLFNTRRGKPATFYEANAFEILVHEINHLKTPGKNLEFYNVDDKTGRRYADSILFETANEAYTRLNIAKEAKRVGINLGSQIEKIKKAAFSYDVEALRFFKLAEKYGISEDALNKGLKKLITETPISVFYQQLNNFFRSNATQGNPALLSKELSDLVFNEPSQTEKDLLESLRK